MKPSRRHIDALSAASLTRLLGMQSRTTATLSVRVRLLWIRLIDVAFAVSAWALTYLFRYDFGLPDGSERTTMLWGLLIAIAVQAVANEVVGLGGPTWSTSGLHDLRLLGKAAVLGSLGIGLVMVLTRQVDSLPRSALILYPILYVLCAGGARLAYRLLSTERDRAARGGRTRRILVCGDHAATAPLLADLRSRGDATVVGAISLEAGMSQRRTHGVDVVGVIADIGEVLDDITADLVILALTQRDPGTTRSVARACAEHHIPLVTRPFGQRLLAVPAVEDLRPVVLEDLLERPIDDVADIDAVQEQIRGRCVLVTGGAGSIGSQLATQVAYHAPSTLVVFDASEYNLYALVEAFAEAAPAVNLVPVLGDVNDQDLVEKVFTQYQPELVFHAAAYKHVPLLQANPTAAVRTNVAGTASIARAADRHGTRTFVLISTDKAVEPSSVMGSTKRLAEHLVTSMSAHSDTQFVVVRFGNVLESSGSVVPKFRAQIMKGGPVTVTHPDVTRFFMTIPEACGLILQAMIIGESGEVMVLDMGESLRIADLAQHMIELAGHDTTEIPIEYTGLRPGEKLAEQLFYDAEALLATRHPRINRAAVAWSDTDTIEGAVDIIAGALSANERAGVEDLLRDGLTAEGVEVSIDLRADAAVVVVDRSLPTA